MKLFILKILLFLCLFTAFLWLIYPYCCAIIPNPRQQVYVSLAKSSVKKKTKKLILGDSCGEQLYDNTIYNGTVYSLACNQAISMVGQYILLSRFFQANAKDLPDEVCLIMDIHSFRNNLDQPYTYTYFLKPFYTRENLKYFSTGIMKCIREIPLYRLSQWPMVAVGLWCPDHKPPKSSGWNEFFPEEMQSYLQRIQLLCEKHQVKLRIFPAIMPVSAREKFNYSAMGLKKSLNKQMLSLFEPYFQLASFKPDTCFFDGIHLTAKNIPGDYYKLAD